MAAPVSRDPGTALPFHTREELGVGPFGLPSAILAGPSSLVAFSLGALVPLLPNLAGLPVLATERPLCQVSVMFRPHGPGHRNAPAGPIADHMRLTSTRCT